MNSGPNTPKKVDKSELIQHLSHQFEPENAKKFANFISEAENEIISKYEKFREKIAAFKETPSDSSTLRELRQYCMSLTDEGEEKIQKEVSSRNDKIEQQRQKVATLREEKNKMMENIATLKEEKERLKERLESKNQGYEELEGANSDLKAKYNAQTRKIENQREKINKLESTISELREATTDLSELKELKEHYENQLERREAQIQSLEERLEEKERERQAVKEMVTKLRKELRRIKETAQTRETEEATEELSDFASKLEKQFSSIREGLSEDLIEATSTEGSTTSLKKKIDTLKSHIDEFETENKKLQLQLGETKEELKKLQNKNQTLKQEVQKQQAKIGTLEMIPEEMGEVLKLSPVGKAYDILRDMEETTYEQLASAMGISKIKARRYVVKLKEAGLAEIQGSNILYKGKV